MEENNTKQPQPEVIDLREVVRKLLSKKKLYYKVLAITFVLACIYSLGIPRYYTSEVKLAPELDNATAGGALSSLASSFGLDLGNMQTTDAISPILYPDLMEDNGFVCGMYNIKVVSEDGEINTNYHDYLKKYQKRTIWTYPIVWIKKLVKFKKEGGGAKAFNPYYLSEDEENIANKIRDAVSFSVDKRTGVITITAEAQDPLICKTLADSIKDRLQLFITDYRTSKARTDYNYYKQLVDNAKLVYEKARQIYGSMSDANSKVVLRSVELKMQDMENDMQLKFNAYSTLSTQLEAAKAKVQERTPAFTVIKGAAVPVKHSGPKRMFFVIGMLFVAFICTSIYILREDLLAPFKASKQ